MKPIAMILAWTHGMQKVAISARSELCQKRNLPVIQYLQFHGNDVLLRRMVQDITEEAGPVRRAPLEAHGIVILRCLLTRELRGEEHRLLAIVTRKSDWCGVLIRRTPGIIAHLSKGTFILSNQSMNIFLQMILTGVRYRDQGPGFLPLEASLFFCSLFCGAYLLKLYF